MDELIEKLNRAIETKLKHDKARDEYIEGAGYEWGYHGRQGRQNMDEAANDFKNCLKDAIREVVREEIEANV